MTRAWVMLAVLLGGCEAPPVVPGADARQGHATGRIEGQVVAQTRARGDAVLFLFDAARPPPPQGTGRPVSFTVVTEAALFGAAPAGQAGPFVAPFAFSLVAPGRYLLKGFLDANHDFIPWYGVTADANAGDVGGGAVEASTRALAVLTVASPDGGPAALTGVTVGFSDPATVPVDRPAFALPSEGAVVLGSGATRVTLSATPLTVAPAKQEHPTFLARLVDEDGDGRPDDANGDGVPDCWPRVVVRKLAEAGLTEETGVDREHLDAATGATIQPDGVDDVTVLAAGFDLTALLPRLLEADGGVRSAPVPVSTLDLVVKAQALDVASGKPQPVKGVPAGRYGVTVIQSTGQTWRVPNELAPAVAPALGLPPVASQGAFLQVP